MDNQILSFEEGIISKLIELRGRKVILDRDLAILYGVNTKALKQTVKRNIDRFPEDFMFEMNKEEFQHWRSQNVTSNADLMGLRYAPYCFTELGVTMISCLLRSPLAIEVNIKIVRVFNSIRTMAIDLSEIRNEVEKVKQKMNDHDENIIELYRLLNHLITLEDLAKNAKPIGFEIGN